MIDINFDNLFTVELLHKYFADQLCPVFSITPSRSTLSLINGHKIIVKQYHHKLYAGVQSAAGKPFLPVEDGLHMMFYLWLNDPLFFNYTNLPAAYDAGKICYFTNRNNTAANGKNLLSAAIPVYNNAVSYVPGDLAVNGAGLVHRAIRSNNNADQHALTDPAFWTAIDHNAYAAGNDALQYLPSVSTYSFTADQSAAVISVLGYNSATNDYTLPVLSETITFLNPVPSFKLELSSLGTGKYSLTVNGVQQWIYINDELSNNRPFGVIDIYNAASPASCNLVDGSGTLLKPPYSIYFLNRATVWKYVLPPGKTGTISDNAGAYSFTSLANDITSTAPIPLSDGLLNFKLTVNGIPFTPIPCADVQRLASLTLGLETYACSEIFINY
jgi:hypothetical protein